MPDRGGSFLVEEFLDAITAQLDQVQDALAFKARNRPLTYAVKDFAMELKVFVEMNEEGKVVFRPAGPQEEGASRVELGFTTITRPMIEENTVSLNVFNSPSLEELGLDEQERKNLGRFGVRNAAELKKLKSNVGVNAISRLSGVRPVRLSDVIERARPSLERVEPESPDERTDRRSRFERPSRRRAQQERRTRKEPSDESPRTERREESRRQDLRRMQRDRLREEEPTEERDKVVVAPGVKRLRFKGRNLIGDKGPMRARLNNQPLELVQVDEDLAVFQLPEDAAQGELLVELPDEEVQSFQLSFAGEEGANLAWDDPWAPGMELK